MSHSTILSEIIKLEEEILSVSDKVYISKLKEKIEKLEKLIK